MVKAKLETVEKRKSKPLPKKKAPAKPKGMTKKQVLGRVREITDAMDYFRDRATRLGFTPPEDKSWLELRRLVEEAKSME
jgi:hypothetical protein